MSYFNVIKDRIGSAVSFNHNFPQEGGLVVEFSTIGGFLWLKDTAG